MKKLSDPENLSDYNLFCQALFLRAEISSGFDTSEDKQKRLRSCIEEVEKRTKARFMVKEIRIISAIYYKIAIADKNEKNIGRWFGNLLFQINDGSPF